MARKRRSDVEWVGGTLATSLVDRQKPGSTAPIALTAWFASADSKIVAQAIHPAEETEGRLAGLLQEALDHPDRRRRGRPDRIRIADPDLAREIREVVGSGVPIEVAPTPELDHFRDMLVELFDRQDDDPAYLEEADLDPRDLHALFKAARVLQATEPWTVVAEHQPIRLDAPAFGVEGACVVVGGNSRDVAGLLIFPSDRAHRSFLAAAEQVDERQGAAADPLEGVDFGTEWLALSLLDPETASPRRLDEAAEQGWPFDPDNDFYPLAMRMGRHGRAVPLQPHDLRLLAACASAIGTFARSSSRIFGADASESASAFVEGRPGPELRFTYPADCFDQFESGPAPARRDRKVGRNDPCPCGSGRKYKKCHMQADRERDATATETLHERDVRLTWTVVDYAQDVLSPDEVDRALRKFEQADELSQFAGSWVAYDLPFEGETAVVRFLRKFGKQIPAEDRAWLEARAAAWLSVWEVIHVDPGRGLQLGDPFTLEMRYVTEKSGSESLVARDTILGRVADHDGRSFLCGAHPRILPPSEGADLVRRARQRLRVRKGAVPVKRLREDAFGRYLIGRWDASVRRLERNSVPRELINTTGEPLLLTVDRFRHDAADEVERRLSTALELRGGESTEEGRAFSVLDPEPRADGEGHSILAELWLSERTLKVGTTSLVRADAMRRKIEEACGELVRYRIREVTDPLSPKVIADAAERAAHDPGPPLESDPAVAEAMRDYKRRYYKRWLDESIPALGGRTPREAVRSAEGRGAVDLLLKDMENMEARSAPESAIDFGVLRKELGLDC